ncbi:MAG: phosphotransferase [Cupriavidus sp.]|nr:phosphotransferase [Cupriavidus sp.]
MEISAAAAPDAGFIRTPANRSEDGDNELFSISSPKLSPDEAVALAYRAFGISGSATVLSSERDQNFRLDAAGQSYVLKVTHPLEDPGVTDFQTQAQLQLMRGGNAVPVPRLYRALSGDYTYWHDIPGTALRQAVRLISFLPGVPLYKARAGSAQRYSLGAALAHFDAALAGFSHPHATHRLLWDLQHLADLRPLLAHVDDVEKSLLAARAMDDFVRYTGPKSQKLRRQVIHNDMNAYNVMVDEHDVDRVTASLDFGDMVEAPLVNDLAVACAYQLSATGNPMTSALDCVRGYQRVNPLTVDELDVLPGLVVGRLLATALITEWRAKEHPENRTYILRNNPIAWAGLQRFAAISPQEVGDSVFEAIQTVETRDA